MNIEESPPWIFAVPSHFVITLVELCNKIAVALCNTTLLHVVITELPHFVLKNNCSYIITGILLQSATSVITKWNRYFKARQELLQSATGIKKCDVITKCDGTVVTHQTRKLISIRLRPSVRPVCPSLRSPVRRSFIHLFVRSCTHSFLHVFKLSPFIYLCSWLSKRTCKKFHGIRKTARCLQTDVQALLKSRMAQLPTQPISFAALQTAGWLGRDRPDTHRHQKTHCLPSLPSHQVPPRDILWWTNGEQQWYGGISWSLL